MAGHLWSFLFSFQPVWKTVRWTVTSLWWPPQYYRKAEHSFSENSTFFFIISWTPSPFQLKQEGAIRPVSWDSDRPHGCIRLSACCLEKMGAHGDLLCSCYIAAATVLTSTSQLVKNWLLNWIKNIQLLAVLHHRKKQQLSFVLDVCWWQLLFMINRNYWSWI